MAKGPIMESYAVIQTGGKQYRVEKGSVLEVEHLDTEVGKKVVLDQVLAVSDGKDLTIGAPSVKGVNVTAKVVEHFRGTKLVSFKKKRRKGYKRKLGHRQELTRIEILDLGVGKPAKARKAKEEPKPGETGAESKAAGKDSAEKVSTEAKPAKAAKAEKAVEQEKTEKPAAKTKKKTEPAEPEAKARPKEEKPKKSSGKAKSEEVKENGA
jgi:large subunit ribosomal protein L21